MVLTSDSILWHVGVNYWPSLEKKLPQQWFANLLVQASHVHSGIWTAGEGSWGRDEYDRKGDGRDMKRKPRWGNWGWKPGTGAKRKKTTERR